MSPLVEVSRSRHRMAARAAKTSPMVSVAPPVKGLAAAVHPLLAGGFQLRDDALLVLELLVESGTGLELLGGLLLVELGGGVDGVGVTRLCLLHRGLELAVPILVRDLSVADQLGLLVAGPLLVAGELLDLCEVRALDGLESLEAIGRVSALDVGAERGLVRSDLGSHRSVDIGAGAEEVSHVT